MVIGYESPSWSAGEKIVQFDPNFVTPQVGACSNLRVSGWGIGVICTKQEGLVIGVARKDRRGPEGGVGTGAHDICC